MTPSDENTAKAARPSRRSFLTKLWWALGFVALGEFAAVAAGFLRPRRPVAFRSGFGGIVTAGAVKDFAAGSVTAFKRGRFYLARLEDGGFLALSRTCTHLGCTLPWNDQKKQFICPCHASAFDITGAVVRPPAARALDTYAIRIVKNRVKVDTAKPIRRSQFRSDQVTYAPKTGKPSSEA